MEIVVHDIRRGNKECVVIRVVEDTNMWRYVLFPSGPTPQEAPNNTNRMSFFFGSLNVKAGDYVIVYTGMGENRSFKNKTGSTTHELYWGLDTSLWTREENYVLVCNISDFARFKK